MSRCPLATIILLAAVLLSSWNNVIVAAFCPRYLSSRNCLTEHESRQPKQVDHNVSCHHKMIDMEVGDAQMDEMDMQSEGTSEAADKSIAENPAVRVATESSVEQIAIDFPAEPCGHCWMHSQPASGIATLVAVDSSRRLIETNAPPASPTICLPFALEVPILQCEHGPPGLSLPRHVLINVFRI